VEVMERGLRGIQSPEEVGVGHLGGSFFRGQGEGLKREIRCATSRSIL
jgi:hypothetical protein